MARLLAQVARRSLPVALVVAALVAAGGLVGLLFPHSAQAPAPAAALDLSRASAASGGATLVPQDVPSSTPTAFACPGGQPPCPPDRVPSPPIGCCR